MDEWMDGWMDGWMDALGLGWVSGNLLYLAGSLQEKNTTTFKSRLLDFLTFFHSLFLSCVFFFPRFCCLIASLITNGSMLNNNNKIT